jgi:hypothetical protein
MRVSYLDHHHDVVLVGYTHALHPKLDITCHAACVTAAANLRLSL